MITIGAQIALDTLLIFLSLWNILISPYTKVEESFNVQALHDIINLGLDQLDQFDHMFFPGAVKRTCFSAVVLSLPAVLLPTTAKKWALFIVGLCVTVNSYLPTPLSLLPETDMRTILTQTKIYQLLLGRVFLTLFSCSSVIYLRRSLEYSCSKNSKYIGLWFSLLFYPLPHFLFYSSRFLPNFLCFPIVNVAISHFLFGDIARSLGMFAFIGIVFRFEVLVFTAILGTLSVTGTLRKGTIISFRTATVAVIISTAFSLFLTGRLDSYFWDVSLTFPEIESFVFNVIGGKSEEWGVEPFSSYFTKYLPKLFVSEFEIIPLLSLIFIGVSLYKLKSDKHKNIPIDVVNYDVGTITTLMWTSFFYTLVVSGNGHKEWRFISYVVPVLCLGASSALEYILNHSNKALKLVIYFVITVAFATSVASSIIFGLISSWNYTGGNAAQKLNLRLIEINQHDASMLKPVTVHWDVGTCMSGASLFTQIGDNKSLRDVFIDENSVPKYWIIYDKTENSLDLNLFVNGFDYWIQFENEPMTPLDDDFEWLLIDIVEGYSSINKEAVINLLKTPRSFGFQVLYSITDLDFKWFSNLIDTLIVKEVKGKIYERSEKKVKNF